MTGCTPPAPLLLSVFPRLALCLALMAGLTGATIAPALAGTAIGRINGSFDVTASGAATYAIPIQVGTGVNDLKPGVALVHASQSAPGMAGMGWTLTGFSEISRCALTRAVDGRVQGVRFTAEDRFCLDGQPLILISGVHSAAGALYRPESHTYERVIAYGKQGSGPAWFELRRADGLIQRYGNDADSRIEAGGGPEVLAWALNEVEDKFQQRIGFSYTEDSAHGEYYPADIRWTYGNGETPQQARLRLAFLWEDRPVEDVRGGFLWGVPWRSSARLRAIEYEADAGAGLRLVHRYTLAYALSIAGQSQRSLLSSVTQCGPVDCLPPTTLEWDDYPAERVTQTVSGPVRDQAVFGDFNGDGATDVFGGNAGSWAVWPGDPQTGGFLPPVTIGGTFTDSSTGIVLDYNGDGLADLMTGSAKSSKWVVYLSPATPGGAFAARTTSVPWSASTKIQPLDIDGDGLDDLVYLRNAKVYMRRNLGTFFTAEQSSGIGAVSSPNSAFSGAFGFVMPADFDGDGRADILVARSSEPLNYVNYRWEAFLSTGSGFAPDPIATFTTDAVYTKVVLADMNGDGLTDVLRLADGVWRPYISRGTGGGAAPGLVPGDCPTPPSQGPSSNRTILDYDGDGRSDLLVLSDTGWRVYTSDGSCLDAQRFLEFRQPSHNTVGSVTIAADTDGDGNTDIVFASRSSGQWVILRHLAPIRTDGVTVAHQRNLLRRITDGLGNWHEIAYRPLTGWPGYQASVTAPAGTRLLRGGSLAVVSQYAANTGLGPDAYQVAFQYSGALLDQQGRGFLGFTSSRATDSRNGLVTQTTYRQTFPFTGRVEEVTLWNGASRVSVYDPTWTDSTSPAIDAAQDVHFVHLTADTGETYETDADGGYLGGLVNRATRTLTWNYTHGAVVTEQASVTAPQRSDVVHRSTRATTLDETLRTGADCLGFPSRVDTTRDMNSGLPETRTAQYTYQLSSCRLATQVDGPASLPAQQLRTSYAYDGVGRLSAVVADDGAGQLPPRQRRYAYGAAGVHPSSEVATISGEADLGVTLTWNDALGLLASRVNAQSLSTAWLYDDFGRALTETRSPGFSQFSYSGCGPCFAPNARYAIRELRSDGYWRESQHDSYGRVVGRSAVLPDGRVSRQVVEYDALGRVARESAPYLQEAATLYWTTFQYDIVGRPKSIDRPVSEASPSGALELFTYAGLETTVRDAELRTTVYIRDAEGRLVAVRSPLQSTTAYTYTAFGQLNSVIDPGLNTRQWRYDDRGLLVETNDPDAGRRLYGYNAFGERVTQSDNGSPPAAASWRYDQLGRVTQLTEPEGTTSWTYSPAAGPGRGLLAEVSSPTEGGPGGFREAYLYDSKSRLQRTSTTIDGTVYQTDYAYDTENKLRSMTYPATVGWRPRFVFGYSYGQLTVIAQDNLGPAPIYALVATDAQGRETQASLGYGEFDEVTTYDGASGRLVTIQSGTPDAPVRFQNYAYSWDRAGNLVTRQDLSAGAPKAEQFTYDSLNRLTRASLNGVATLTMAYQPDGNIQSKSDAGYFTYGTGGTLPHAVTAVGGGPRGTMTFGYDARGNMTQRNGATIAWTSFNLPKQVNAGGDYARFTYGPARQRIKQETRTGGAIRTTHYLGPHFEVEIQGSTRRFRSSVFAYGRAVYSQVETTPNGLEAYYLLHDHQGSVDRLVRAAGTGADTLALSFDAWGKRRNTNWTADASDQRYADAHWTERGYTGHEHLDNVRLIHMNGRLEDPLLGRMLSPDPVLGSLMNPQTLNPYSYVANDPTSYIDPSGFFLSKLRDGLRRAVRHVGSFGRRVIRRWGRQIVAAVAAYYTAGAVSSWTYAAQTEGLAAAGGSIASGTLSAAYTSSLVAGGMAGGAVAGAISSGTARGALIGALTGGAMGGVGAHYGSSYSAGRVLAEGAVGGASAELQGGDFGRGFLVSGGLSSLTWASLEMREAMIRQSLLNRTGDNARGGSAGFRGDSFKLGGCRWPCSGSPLGGQQGGNGNFFGIDYQAGSFLDKLVETYAGPHDFLNSPIFYNSMSGNSSGASWVLEALNAANVVVATPFAAASVIPSYAYGIAHD